MRPDHHGKTSNLATGLAHARHPVLIFSDMDIRAPPGALTRLVGALQTQGGVVSCPVAHVGATNLWGRCYATLWNWAIYYMFAPGLLYSFGDASVVGGTVILRRETFEELGGIEAIASYAGDDVALAMAARRHGIRRGCGPELESFVGSLSLVQVLHKYRRLTAGSRQMGWWPLGPLVLMLVTLYPWIVCGLVLFHPRLHVVLAALALLVLRAVYTGWVTGLAGERGRPSWLFIMVDLLLVLASASTLTDTRFDWGGQRMRIARGGRVEFLP